MRFRLMLGSRPAATGSAPVTKPLLLGIGDFKFFDRRSSITRKSSCAFGFGG
jgi:hypothetical protein